jgi:c-di-GMP-binding flagellar brake protein YcgR
MVRGMRMSGESEEQGTQDFLSKLYDYRKKVEMNKPKFRNGITSSRQINEGQLLRVLVPGTGVFSSEVVKIISPYLTISRPFNNKITGHITWNGMKISIYFWREDDAGYVFDTAVIDEVFSKGISSLKIEHNDSLFRTQKRRSIRVRTHKPAYLYPVNGEVDLSKIEEYPGVKCFLEDFSDTGCAVTIGGQGEAGLRIKVQFDLNSNLICMSGTVRSLEYKKDLNRSLLHVEADPLPIETRNHIMGEVLGMLPEDEEDLPFRLLDEAEENVAEPAQASLKPDFTIVDTDRAETVF